MDSEKLQILKSTMDTLGKTVTKKEFLDAFKKVLEIVKNIKDTNTQEWEQIHQAMKNLPDKMMSDMYAEMSKTKKKMMDKCMTEMQKPMKEYEAKMKAIDEKMDAVQDGKDADEEKIVADVLAKVPIPPFLTSIEIRDRLEILKQDERLDKSAVKGIDKLEQDIQEVKNRPSGRIGGAKGFTLYVDGAKKLLTAQTLNLVPGTGVSLTYSYANGRNDITINASGAALSILAATGAIDGVNTVYTFPSTPQVVVVNGVSYRNGHGVTIVTTTATLDFAPVSGSDVYGIG